MIDHSDILSLYYQPGISLTAWFSDIPDTCQVLIYASLTALATGLGALPFLFFKGIAKRWSGFSSALAAGLMLTASFKLIEEGIDYHLWRLLLGIAAGTVLISWSYKQLAGKKELEIGKLKGADALKALMIVGVMTVHSLAEGVGVGVSFGGGENFGIYISTAIAIHNIPEGLAISIVLISQGVSVWKSALWSIFSSLPQPLLALPSYLFVETFEPFLPFGLGFASGAMIWMVVTELIPDSFENAGKQRVALGVVAGVLLMIFLQEVI
ncbi:MAG: ZIP family metal transporter [Saprospiraceae bacterium]|nr:ZIP family metal transporter [Saprospiraceae bacterium]